MRTVFDSKDYKVDFSWPIRVSNAIGKLSHNWTSYKSERISLVFLRRCF